MSDLPTPPAETTAPAEAPAPAKRATPETAGKYVVLYHLNGGALEVIGGIETPEHFAAKSPRAARKAAIEDEGNVELREAIGLAARSDGIMVPDDAPPLVIAVPAASFVAVPVSLKAPPPKLVV